jgi:hypothetical protein
MKLECSLPIEGENRIFKCDVVEYKGAFWLVPTWLVNPEKKLKKPARIIRIDQFPHQDLGNVSGPLSRFAINEQIPKALFDDEISPELQKQFVVEIEPNILLPSDTH